MEESDASNIVKWYISIEEQVSEFVRIVPPYGQNMKTWSPRLASLIVDACSIIDSLFRYISDEEVLVNGKQKKRDELEMPDYKELYSSQLGLGERKVIFLISPPEYRTPFGVWLKPEEDKYLKIPAWWTVNNHLKHSRIKRFNEAKLNIVVNALAGSLAVIASAAKLIPELWPAMIRQGWVEFRRLGARLCYRNLAKRNR